MFGWHAKEKPTSSERILGVQGEGIAGTKLLFSSAQARTMEATAVRQLPPHTLMARAGLAVAQLAMAIAPHARRIWISCGPGNNGGDGFEAAMHLQSWGKSPVVTCLCDSSKMPVDAAASLQNALDAGVNVAVAAPLQYDLCIDALFGIGQIRPWDERCAQWMQQMNSGAAPVLAVDIPSGLNADTGATRGLHVTANYTLSLLTLKPGLFTADGRQASGDIWFNDLGVPRLAKACAQLNASARHPMRAHNTHKGSYGDVCIVGGSTGMTGAAVLAARAALRGGAGRVYVSLQDSAAARLDICQPELMFRDLTTLDCHSLVVVAGCGGGDAISGQLPHLLTQSAQLVLDADALNAVAKDTGLQSLLVARPPHSTVLTPHPLEAARLLQTNSAEVQAHRLDAAQTLADRFACVVVLKGSGTVIAAPNALPHINTTGNARLATAGTGDVLAGLIGARLANGHDTFTGACESVFRHGLIADAWASKTSMTASNLAQAL